MITFDKPMKQSYHIHALHPWDVFENLLWNHQLGHPCDQYLYNYHKYSDGVPKSRNSTYKLLYQYSTFIQASISKSPPGHGTARDATQPYQGLTIYFAFSVITSDESDQNNLY